MKARAILLYLLRNTLLLGLLIWCFKAEAQISTKDSIYIYSILDEILKEGGADISKSNRLLDSLMLFEDLEYYPEELAHIAYVKSTVKYYEGAYVLSDSICNNALAFFINNNDSLNQSICYLQLSSNAIAESQLDSAEHYLLISKEIKERINDKMGLAYVYNNFGILEDHRGDFLQSIEQYQQALSYFEKLDKKNMMSNVWNNISILRYFLEDVERAIDAQNKAIALNIELGDNYNLGMNYVCLSTYLSEIDCLDESLEVGLKALSLSKDIKSRIPQIYALSCLGELKMKTGNYEESLDYFQKFMAIVDQNVNVFEKASTLYKMANLNLKLKQYNAAIADAFKALNIFKGIEYRKEIMECNELLSKIHAEQGSFKKAYIHSIVADSLQNEIFNKEKQKQIRELEVKYESQKQQDSIKILTINEQAAVAEGEHQRKINYFLWAIIGLVSIATYFYFRSYKREQRITAFLDDKNKKLNSINSQLLLDIEEARKNENPFELLKNSFFELDNKTKTKIKLNDIVYIQFMNRQIHIHTKGGTVYKDWQSLKACAEILPQEFFIYIHRSFIVNVYHITRKPNGILVMSTDENLKISRGFKTIVEEKLKKFSI